MADTPSISGVPDPRKSSDIQKDSVVDSDKFKRMMKVDKSDEAEKREKRQRPRQQEEDEEVEEEVGVAPPPGAFNALLGEKERGPTIFDAGEGLSERDLEAPSDEELPPTPLVMIREDTLPPLQTVPPLEDALPTQKRERKDEPDTVIVIKKGGKKEPAAPTRTKTVKTAPVNSAPETEIARPTKRKKARPTKAPTTNAEEPPILPPSIEDRPTAPPREKPIPTSHDLDKQKVPIEEKLEADASETFTPPPPLAPLLKEALQKETVKEKALPAAATTTTTTALQPELPPPPTPISAAGAAAATPAYATLKSDLFELFEKMVGVMTLETYKGVSTTTITLNMPGSAFHGSEVTFEHFDTAPHCFNVSLLGTPEALHLMDAHLPELAAAFTQSNLPYQVNLQRPILLATSRPLFSRKPATAAIQDDTPDDDQYSGT